MNEILIIKNREKVLFVLNLLNLDVSYMCYYFFCLYVKRIYVFGIDLFIIFLVVRRIYFLSLELFKLVFFLCRNFYYIKK